MSLKFTFSAILFLNFSCLLIGQEVIKIESDTHIFWQYNRLLKTEDFKGDGSTNPKCVKYCEDKGMCTVASLGLFAVLDVPKKKSNMGRLFEKAYFAPAFEKTTSYILNKDSFGIEKQQIVFDLFEISARFARQDVYIDKRKGAYQEWRANVDKLLDQSKNYATKPDDCLRFIKKAPIDENYVMAKHIVGNLFENKKTDTP